MAGYQVVEFAADPYEWRDALDEWTALYGDVVVEIPTNSRQRFGPACDRFRAAVLERRLTHADNEILARHIGHAVANTTPYGTTIEKQHHDSPKRIDAIVAAVLAYDRAMWRAANPPQPRDLHPMVAYR